MPTSNERKMLSSNEALKELTCLHVYQTKKMHFKEPLLYCVMWLQVATSVYDPFKPLPQQLQI